MIGIMIKKERRRDARMNDYQACCRQLEGLYQDPAIRDRRYYPDFRRSWDALLSRAAESELRYFDPEAPSVITIPCSYGGLDFDFHLDQDKMADWYYRACRRSSTSSTATSGSTNSAAP